MRSYPGFYHKNPSLCKGKDPNFIFQKGDIAKEMYFIVDGEVEIMADGKTVDRVGSGDFFGEVGLRYGVARTASVRVAVKGDGTAPSNEGEQPRRVDVFVLSWDTLKTLFSPEIIAIIDLQAEARYKKVQERDAVLRQNVPTEPTKQIGSKEPQEKALVEEPKQAPEPEVLPSQVELEKSVGAIRFGD